MWASIVLAEQGDEDPWMDGRSRTSKQHNNKLVLVSTLYESAKTTTDLQAAHQAGLLLATTSVVFTTPPPDPKFLNYTRRGPYLCIHGSNQ